ncbi:hypothetical protein N7478_013020 [Penicillium angulare]|uniref:uncharacterized protein n=1 Tax=Penicillium angulare TaxID=116970 RepID=UPI0025407695|nr:uncharacterized protein N7478_013020 [Penicillium angulare]KAJ5256916.1 hypothetical protein N7478_013020 [Penicillium angulare]
MASVLARRSALRAVSTAQSCRIVPVASRSAQLLGRRLYSSGKSDGGHENHRSSDLPWLLGSVGVTAPMVWYLLQTGPEKKSHDDAHAHGHGSDEAHKEEADEKEAAPEGEEKEEPSKEEPKEAQQEAKKEDSSADSKNEQSGEDKPSGNEAKSDTDEKSKDEEKK